MNSLEKLQVIEQWCKIKGCFETTNIKLQFDAIKKDLDLLKTIKEVVIASPMTIRAIEVSKNYEEYEKNCKLIGCLIATSIVYHKIKEWLECKDTLD